MSNLITGAESTRLETLTRYNSTILNRLKGDALESVLGGELKRRGRLDGDYRQAAIAGVHPDDLCAAIAAAGYSLASFGIESLQLEAL